MFIAHFCIFIFICCYWVALLRNFSKHLSRLWAYYFSQIHGPDSCPTASPNQVSRRRRFHRSDQAPGSALPNQAGDEHVATRRASGQQKRAALGLPFFVRCLYRVGVDQHFRAWVRLSNGLLYGDTQGMSLLQRELARQLQV